MMESRRALAVGLLGQLALACGGNGDGAGADGGGQDGGPDSGLPSVVEPSNRFAVDSEQWSVPASGLEDGFDKPSSFAEYRYWNTLDVDGDHSPDIVHTGAIDLTQSAWDADGSPFWKLFRGGEQGWSADAATWQVPRGGGSSGFFAAGIDGGGWHTFDITGDGLPDLVETADPETGAVWDHGGEPHWKVFPNDGDGGFDVEGIPWPVPDSGTSAGFSVTEWSSFPGFWSTFDIDGDRRPDLVQTGDPATGNVWGDGDSPHWKVFRNAGDGFDRDAILWSVPDSGTTGGFYNIFADSTAHWRVLDLDGDRRADLVQTSDPANGAVWDVAGDPYWKVFAGGDQGFEGVAVEWSVPRNGLAEGFFDAFWNAPNRRWWTIDIDGDRDLDLVQTGDVAHDQRVWDATGDPYWKVFRNQGSGFSGELHRWPVPTSGTADGFFAIGGAYESNWTLLDVDADGHLDLVQTEDPSTGYVWDATGSPYWKVFRGEP